MRYREIGGSGIQASVVLGAWAIGGWFWGGAEEGDAIEAIHAALDGGMNLLDTAPIYGMGHSEVVVGKAIKGRRDKVVLAHQMRPDLGRQQRRKRRDSTSPPTNRPSATTARSRCIVI